VTRKGQYRELFEKRADIVYTHDLEGNFRSVNKAVERVAGYSRAEVSRMSLFQLLEPDSSEAVRETIRAILGGSPRTTFEVTLLTGTASRSPWKSGAGSCFVAGVRLECKDRPRHHRAQESRSSGAGP